MTLERVAHLGELVSDCCQDATGYRLPHHGLGRPGEVGQSGFRNLVDDCYGWLYESWSVHLRLLGEAAPAFGLRWPMRSFLADINALSTSERHRGRKLDERMLRDRDHWFQSAVGMTAPGSEADWGICTEALLSQAQNAMETAVGVAKKIVSNEDWRQRWTVLCDDQVDLDVPTAVSDLAEMIGLSLSEGERGYLQRDTQRDWDRQAMKQRRREVSHVHFDKVVTRKVLGFSLGWLPVTSARVFERLDTKLGDESGGALRLALALESVLDYDSEDEFLEMLEDVWHRIADLRTST